MRSNEGQVVQSIILVKFKLQILIQNSITANWINYGLLSVDHESQFDFFLLQIGRMQWLVWWSFRLLSASWPPCWPYAESVRLHYQRKFTISTQQEKYSLFVVRFYIKGVRYYRYIAHAIFPLAITYRDINTRYWYMTIYLKHKN